jgi:hypothetical protein
VADRPPPPSSAANNIIISLVEKQTKPSELTFVGGSLGDLGQARGHEPLDVRPWHWALGSEPHRPPQPELGAVARSTISTRSDDSDADRAPVGVNLFVPAGALALSGR